MSIDNIHNKFRRVSVRAKDKNDPDNNIPYNKIAREIGKNKSPETLMMEGIQRIRKDLGYE